MFRLVVKLFLLATVCLLFTGGNAVAESRSGTFTVSPMVGYHVIDGGMNLDDAAAFGLGLGYSVSPEWALEADLRYTPTETDSANSIDIDIWTVSLGTLYHFRPEAVLTPYLSLGAGLMIYDIDNTSSNDEDVFGYYGGGIKYSLSRSTALRLDARHLLDYRSDKNGSTPGDTNWRHHFQAMAGLTFQFDSASAAPAKQAPVPETVAKKEAKAPMDSDRDGVLDSLDKCPGTAPGVRIDRDGCPADTDGDGVKDYLDACVDTPEGVEIDQRGCPQAAEEVAVLTLNLLFGFDKDQITPFHYHDLNKAAEFIKEHPMYPVVIKGYADDQGATKYNQDLSQRRADNVRNVLIKKYKVYDNRIRAVGFGEVQPVAGNDVVEERMRNRRVVINLRP